MALRWKRSSDLARPRWPATIELEVDDVARVLGRAFVDGVSAKLAGLGHTIVLLHVWRDVTQTAYTKVCTTFVYHHDRYHAKTIE